jgi:hypothetical protein
MTWFNCKEIRVREHTAKGRPGSRPCLMVVYSLEDHGDAFDFLAFESDKLFAREKAASRWLELRGKQPPPFTTAEAIDREGELEVPVCIMLTQDGSWERVNKVRFDKELKAEAVAAALDAESLIDDQTYLDEATTPTNSQFNFPRFKGST